MGMEANAAAATRPNGQDLSFAITLEFPAQEFDDRVSDQTGRNSDSKICQREDVRESVRQTFSARAVGPLVLAHQEIRVEKKHYEDDLDYESPAFAVHFGVLVFPASLSDTAALA
jgi:hypothetical protein